MASAGKGKNKKKGKTVDLHSFLAEGENGAAPGYALANTGSSWADEVENLEENDVYTPSTRIYLPTAPKAARGPDVDLTKIPSQGPFKAFLANVPYDVDKSDIEEFFSGLKLKDVKLPREGGGDAGRLKGFAYAEFDDLNSLLEALSLTNETIKNRPIRIDIAGTSQDGERERGGRFEERIDRTPDDWRSAPRADLPPRDSRGPRDGFDRGGYSAPSGRDERDSFSRNDRGPSHRDVYDNRESGYRHNDRQDGGPDRNDRGPERYDRGSDRYDRGPDRYDRGQDRYDRGYDRGPDRYDRGPDRYDRGGPDRYDRRPDRFDRGPDQYDRGPDRYGRGSDRYDRGSDRYDRRSNDRYERPPPPRDRHDRGFNDRYERSGPDNRDDRGYGRRDRYDDRRYNTRDDGPPSAAPDDVPQERPRLQLQKRTVPVTNESEKANSTSSIFGGAKPVDTASKEREVELKLAREKREKEQRAIDSTEKGPNYDGNRRRSREDVRSSSRNSGGKPRRDSERSQDAPEEGQQEKDEPKQANRTVSPKRENAKLIPAPPPTTNAWKNRKSSFTQEGKSETSTQQKEPERNPETKGQPSHPDLDNSKKVGDRKPHRNDDFPKKKDQRNREDGRYGGRGGGYSDRGSSRGDRVNSKNDDRSHRPEKDKHPKEPVKYEDPKPQDFTSTNKFAQLMEDNVDPGSTSE